jgi:hypothetical protein
MTIRQKMLARLLASASGICYVEAAVAGDAGAGAAAAVVAGSTVTGDSGKTTGVPTGPAWFGDATPEDIAHITNRGWDKFATPAEAAKSIYQGYRAAEKLIGAEKMGNTVVVPGETADQAAKDAFYNRIGRPATADKYGIDVKTLTGMNETTAKEFVELSHKLGLTTSQAKGFAEWNNTKATAISATLTENAKIEHASQVQALKDEWGSAYDKNAQVVNEAATRLGLDAKDVQALKIAKGADGAMKLLLKLGQQVGEGRFVGGDNNNRGSGTEGAMTPAQAKIAMDNLLKTPEFKAAALNRLHPDHASMMAKKAQLSVWMTAGQSQAS